MWLIYICLIALAIYIDYIIAKEFYATAKKKGWDSKVYFWWTFWVQPIGILMVIALPDRGSVEPDELPDL